MKTIRFLSLLCAVFLFLSSAACAEGDNLSWFEWSAQPFSDQPDASNELLEPIAAWAAQYEQTDFEALFCEARIDQEFSGTASSNMLDGFPAEGITGPYFSLCVQGTDQLYRGYADNDAAKALKEGKAYLRMHMPDSAIAATENAQRLFSLQYFQKIAAQNSPALFCVLESADYSPLGQYSLLNETGPQLVCDYKYRIYVLNAVTGEVVAWRAFEPPYMSAPDEIAVHKDMNGYYVSEIGEEPWKSFFSRLKYVDALSVDGEEIDVDMNAEEIVLPEGLTEIGENAFAGNEVLKSITIPEGVVRIGPQAFAGCTALSEVILPDSLLEIGESAFRDCKALESITLPSQLTEIGDAVFFLSTSLHTINFPAGLKRIGDNVFTGASLTEINLPNGLESIGYQAFKRVKNVQSIVVPGSVKEVGKSAFAECSDLTSLVFEEGVESIGTDFCYNCSSLKEITFPSTLRIPSELKERFFDSISYGIKIQYTEASPQP